MISQSVFTNFNPILKGYKRKINFPSSSVDKRFSQHHFEPTPPLHVFLASLSKVSWIKMGYIFILQPIPLINKITFINNFFIISYKNTVCFDCIKHIIFPISVKKSLYTNDLVNFCCVLYLGRHRICAEVKRQQGF